MKKTLILCLCIFCVHSYSSDAQYKSKGNWYVVDSIVFNHAGTTFKTGRTRRIKALDRQNCVSLSNLAASSEYEIYSHPVVRYTSDGGKTWKTLFQFNFPNGPRLNGPKGSVIPGGYSLAYLTKDIILVGTSYGRIYRTDNGGQSWDTLFIDSVNRNNIYWMDFSKKEKGTGLINGEFITTDYGLTWNRLPNMFSYETPMAQLLVFDKNHIVGNTSLGLDFFETKDGGKTWQVWKTNVKQGTYMYNMDFIDTLRGWWVGNFLVKEGYRSDVIYNTTDGGKTWIQQLDTLNVNDTTPHAQGLENISMYDENNGVAVGPYKVLMTSNGGTTWKVQAMPWVSPPAIMPDVIMPAIDKVYTLNKVGDIFTYDPHFLPTGLNDDGSFNENTLLYPNPVRDNVTVRIAEIKEADTRIELYSVTGDIVFSRQLYSAEGTVTLDFSSVSNGTYYYIISNNNGKIRWGQVQVLR